MLQARPMYRTLQGAQERQSHVWGDGWNFVTNENRICVVIAVIETQDRTMSVFCVPIATSPVIKYPKYILITN